MDVDIGKVPEPHQLPPTSEPASISTLDGWIESLVHSCWAFEIQEGERIDEIRLDAVTTLAAVTVELEVEGSVMIIWPHGDHPTLDGCMHGRE